MIKAHHVIVLVLGLALLLFGLEAMGRLTPAPRPDPDAPPPTTCYSEDPGVACAEYCELVHGWVVAIEGRPGELPTCTCDTWRVTGEYEIHIDPDTGCAVMRPPS